MVKHKFQLVIDGLQFNQSSVTFEEISEDFKNIELFDLNDIDSNFELIVTNQETSPIQISIDEAKRLADEFADRLSLIKNHDIKFLQYVGYFNNNEVFVLDKKVIALKPGTGHIIYNPKKYYSELHQKNIINDPKNSSLKRVYRNSLSLNDSISQYLILYALLQILIDGNQQQVDNYIKEKINGIPMISNRDRKSETIITKTRNMIAHPNEKLKMEELTNNVNLYLEQLRELVSQTFNGE